uniref:DUF4219 domain-containing protein n=1 Tax=Oryza meridionalis TaxID=40149 RepID=A0A0E0EPK6_9ORYZ
MGDDKKLIDGTSKEGVVIQRVIREVGGGSSYPVLTKTNYSNWALLMKNLRHKFDLATFNDGEAIEDFVLHLNGMATTLATLGEKLEKSTIVNKIIRSVPKRLKHIVVVITTLLDVSMLTVEGLTERLQAAEDADEEPTASLQHEGKLYLTEEQWDT